MTVGQEFRNVEDGSLRLVCIRESGGERVGDILASYSNLWE